jgi:hypothetical protein
MSDLVHETGFLRWAYHDLVEHCCERGADPNTIDPGTVLAFIGRCDQTRLAALLYAHQIAESVADGARLLNEVKDWLREGKRPRSMRDVAVQAGEDPEAFARSCGYRGPWPSS